MRGLHPLGAALLALLAATPPACAVPPEPPLRAVLLFTGDVSGYTEPCG